ILVAHNPALNFASSAHSPRSSAVLRGLDRVVGLKHTLRPWNWSEIFRDQRESLRLIELARNDQDRIVGLVVVSIKGLKALDWHVLDIAAGTDRRFPVVVPQIRRGQDALFENIHRRVLSRF